MKDRAPAACTRDKFIFAKVYRMSCVFPLIIVMRIELPCLYITTKSRANMPIAFRDTFTLYPVRAGRNAGARHSLVGRILTMPLRRLEDPDHSRIH